MASSVCDGKSAAAANDLKPQGVPLVNSVWVLGKAGFKVDCANLAYVAKARGSMGAPPLHEHSMRRAKEGTLRRADILINPRTLYTKNNILLLCTSLQKEDEARE